MKVQGSTPEEYVSNLPEERKEPIQKLRKVLKEDLPLGFEEVISYGMLGYVVPQAIYPAGYHCDPKLPLPFINLASQKNFIALYHMGVYANPDILAWFKGEYSKHCKTKLDMGKSCVRFKKMDDIPYSLIAELATKYTVESWVELYENNLRDARKGK